MIISFVEQFLTALLSKRKNKRKQAGNKPADEKAFVVQTESMVLQSAKNYYQREDFSKGFVRHIPVFLNHRA